MPQQYQSGGGSAQANEDSVKAFMELDEAGQTHALSKMSPDAKNWLLLGVRALKSVEPQRTPQKEDQGVIAGFMGRGKGLASMVMPSEAEDVAAIKAHAPERIKETYKEGARQTREQFAAGAESLRKGLPVEGGLSMARGAVTGASMLDPFATGSVVDINRAQDEGRYREAIGEGAFDILNLWAGSKIGRTPSAAMKINKLTSAIGETGETVKNLERVLPEIEQTARRVGKPETIGALADNVKTSMKLVQTEFNSVFDPIKHNRAYTPAIKNHIDRIIRDNPNLAKTPDGRAQLASLRRIQRIYDKPWTLEDMNLERSKLRKEIRDLYDAKPTDAAAKMKLDAELRAKKVVADSFSETVNDHLAHVGGKPAGYYDILRQKQESLMDLNDHLSTQVEKLRDRQAAHAGIPLHERIRPRASAGAAGPRVHVPFGEAVPGGGATDVADRRVREAFGPSKKGRVARAAVLALPLSHLATAGEEAKKSRMTPPPPLEE